MMRLGFGVGLLGLAMAVAAGAQTANGTLRPSENMILGTWVLKSGPQGCNPKLVFAPTSQSITFRGNTSTVPVSGYVAQPGGIIVGGSPGLMETLTYKVIDKNTISRTGTAEPCVWVRK